jgi:probable rRNA maturation factor
MNEPLFEDGKDPEGYEEISFDNCTLGIHVSPAFVGRVDTKRLSDVVRRTIGAARLQKNVELGLVIVDDERIRELNRQFRQVDSPTDVLAFVMSEGDSPALQDSTMPLYLGDVIISFPRAEAQSQAAGHPVDDELDLLAVHGTLHLLGFDHDTEDKKKEMWSRQESILGKRLVD